MKRFIKMSRTGILSLIMLTLVSLQAMQAQDKDSKMAENLKMMEKVLNEVFRSGNPNPDQLNVRVSSTDAQYIEGFGILMRTPLFYWNSSNFISLNGRAYGCLLYTSKLYVLMTFYLSVVVFWCCSFVLPDAPYYRITTLKHLPPPEYLNTRTREH